MIIYFVRHGHPDYKNDCLTELGKKQAEAAGLSDNVHFLGFRNDIKQLYGAVDCFVMPSFREGLSRSIMEAMSTGLPCIVSEIRGNVDMIEQELGGFLCSPTDSASFAEAIRRIADDDALRERMSAFNLENVKKFDSDVVIDEMKNIYRDTFS